MSDKKPVIIEGPTRTIDLSEVLKDVATLLADATPTGSIDTNAERIIISFEDDPSDVVAMYSHDSLFSVTDTEGIPIARLDEIKLEIDQFGARFRTISGTKKATLEQFKLEDF